MKSNTNNLPAIVALWTVVVISTMVQPAPAQSFSLDTPLLAARWSHTATLLTNGLVLIAGGETDNNYGTGQIMKATNGCELYDPLTGKSTLTGFMNDAHFSHTAIRLANGRVLVAGGRNDNGGIISRAELYDPNAGTWTDTGYLNQSRCAFAATLLANGKVLVVGGYTDSGDTSSAELYDPVSKAWTYAAPMTFATDSQTATLLPNGDVLVAGGSDGSGGGLTNSLLYNPANDTWISTGSLQRARAGQVAVLLPSGKVLVAGGASDDNSAEVYDPSADTWSLVAPMNDGRWNPSATLLPNGQVLVLGGYPGQTSAELYNPANNTWTYTGSLNAGRIGHTATLVSQGQVVVAGGDASEYNGPALAAVETYNQATQFNLFAFALNATNLVWTTGGDANWFVETTNTQDGVLAAQSGAITDYQQSWIQTTVTGPGTLTFYWASQDDCANFYYEFDLDGSSLGDIPCNSSWHQDGSFNIPAGQHTLTWTTYANGDSDPAEAGYLDQVSFVTAPTLTVTASPASGLMPLTVQFTSPSVDSLGNSITNWNWSFGDGGTSTTQSPSHTYTTAGSFSPSLTVYSTFGTMPLSVTGPGAITVTPLPAPGTWTITGGMNSIRALQTLTLLPNGKVLASAGEGAGYFSVATAELYDPALGTWMNTGSLAADRYGHTATWLGNGQVLVAGGIQSFSTFGNIASTELYNPTNGTWTANNPMTTSRYGHTATLLGNGKVLVTGGQAHDSTGYTTLASAELYDPNLGLWTLTGTMPNAHMFHTATLLTNGWVLVAGGEDNNGSSLTNADLYNSASGLWTKTGSMTTQRSSHTATLLPDGKVLVAGGFDGSFNLLASAELYDPALGTWTATEAMIARRAGAVAMLLTNGLVLVTGGDGDAGVLSSAELYDPASGTWTPAATMHNQRQQFPAVLLPNGQVLVAGGFYYSSLTNAELYSSMASATLPIRLMNSTWLISGAFQFGFTNTPGAGFTALGTTNLSLSLSNWSVLGSVPEISPGVFQFTDQQAADSPQHFYRVRSP